MIDEPNVIGPCSCETCGKENGDGIFLKCEV